MYCKNCGKELVGQGVFCQSCGTKQDVSNTAQGATAPKNEPTPPVLQEQYIPPESAYQPSGVEQGLSVGNLFAKIKALPLMTKAIAGGVAAVLVLGIIVTAAVSSNRKSPNVDVYAPATSTPTVSTSTPEETVTPSETTPPVTEAPDLAIVKFTDDMYPTKRNNLWGVVNNNGDEIIPFAYTNAADHFSDGLWCVENEITVTNANGGTGKVKKWGYINAANAEVIAINYEGCGEISDGLCAVKQGGKWGFVDLKNAIIITSEYDEVGLFEDGVCPAKQDGFWGVIDTSGNTKINFMYDGMGILGSSWEEIVSTPQFHYGLINVSVNGAYGIIDVDGTYIFQLEKGKNNAVAIGDGYMILQESVASYGNRGERFTLYDFQGTALRKNIVFYATNPYASEKNMMVDIDDNGKLKYYLIDKKGNLLVDVEKITGVTPDNGSCEAIYGKWQLISKGTTFNLMDDVGNLFSNTWFSAGKWSLILQKSTHPKINFGYSGYGEALVDGLMSFYDKELNQTTFYSESGEIVKQSSGFSVIWNANEILRFEQKTGTPLRNFGTVVDTNSSISSKGKILSYSDMTEIIEYGKFQGTSETTAILTDAGGIFQGIYSNGKSIYPAEYNSISYVKNADVFTLQKGNVQTRVRVAKNGRVIILN
jgi:hypothetical protein